MTSKRRGYFLTLVEPEYLENSSLPVLQRYARWLQVPCDAFGDTANGRRALAHAILRALKRGQTAK